MTDKPESTNGNGKSNGKPKSKGKAARSRLPKAEPVPSHKVTVKGNRAVIDMIIKDMGTLNQAVAQQLKARDEQFIDSLEKTQKAIAQMNMRMDQIELAMREESVARREEKIQEATASTKS